MRFKGLAFATVVALTASVFTVPVYAEDTTINITEIDVTGVVTSVNVGDPASKIFGTVITLKTDHDDQIQLTKVRESSNEYKKGTGNSLITTGYATSDGSKEYTSSGTEKTVYTTFTEDRMYDASVMYTITVNAGYKIADYDSQKATTQIKVVVDGMTWPSGFTDINNGTQNGKSVVYFNFASGRLVTPTAKAVTEDIMYRLYNPNSGEHFYTSSSAEKDNLVSVGWIYERIGWIAPSKSNTPVYRLYNPNAGDHHYTMNWNEKESLVAVGWNDEGIGWYSDDNQTVELYREYNPNAKAGSHNYTTDQNENDFLVKAGWQFEGTAWYALRTE